MVLISRRKLLTFISSFGKGLLLSPIFGILSSCQNEEATGFGNHNLESSLGVRNESGNFIDEVERLKTLVLSKDSNLYQPPTEKELKEFERLAKALFAEKIEETLSLAENLDYELVNFVDQPTQTAMYCLREKEMANQTMRGWGSYFVQTDYKANALVEAPHPLFDRFSPEIAAKTFLISAAKGFLMAGAHRNANGEGTADVCAITQSIFQEVHKAWLWSETTTWQIHGFQASGNKQFPARTEAILSSGEGNILPETLKLAKELKKISFNTYIYNQLSVSNPLNKKINGDIAGETFSALAGTNNVQGKYSRSVRTSFIHIELDASIRNKAFFRKEIARAIANSI